MSVSLFLIYGMLILSILAPFIALYAVKLAKQGKFEQHIKIQKNLFYACVLGVILLELTIRFSGGSGSLVKGSPYLETVFFHNTLWAHIVGAVLTYLIWGFTILKSKGQHNKKYLPGKFTRLHKTLGYVVILGLFYTGITALMVCSMAFFN
ncbi:hypothetical protein OBK05_11820 [Empedobacter falsenii]